MNGVSVLTKGSPESFLERTQSEGVVSELGAGPQQTLNLLESRTWTSGLQDCEE